VKKMKGFIGFWTVLLVVLLLSSVIFAAEIELDFWASAAPTRDEARYMVFNKVEAENPGLKINFEGIPWSNFMEKILTSVVAGTAPDAVRYAYTPRLASRGLIEPLDEYIENDPDFDINEYIPTTFGPVREFNGKIYSLPFNLEPYVILYNVEMFEEAGITELPTNWKELREVAQKLTIRDENGEVIQRGFEFYEDSQYFWAFCMNNGGPLWLEPYDHNASTAHVYSPEALETLEFLVDWIKDGSASFSIEHVNFPTEQTAMWFVQSSQGHDIRPEYYPDLKFDAFALPANNGKKQYLSGHSADALMIFKSSENKEMAWKLIKEMGSKWATATVWGNAHGTPFGKYGMLLPYKDVLTNNSIIEYEPYRTDPYLTRLYEMVNQYEMSEMSPRYWHMRGDELQSIMNEELGAAYRMIKSPEEALKSIDRRWNKVLQESLAELTN